MLAVENDNQPFLLLGNHNADDVAKELAHPHTTLASIVFKNQFKLFTGDLPDADDQNSDFGPRWMFSFNITPVIENGLAKLFR